MWWSLFTFSVEVRKQRIFVHSVSSQWLRLVLDASRNYTESLNEGHIQHKGNGGIKYSIPLSLIDARQPYWTELQNERVPAHFFGANKLLTQIFYSLWR